MLGCMDDLVTVHPESRAVALGTGRSLESPVAYMAPDKCIFRHMSMPVAQEEQVAYPLRPMQNVWVASLERWLIDTTTVRACGGRLGVVDP